MEFRPGRGDERLIPRESRRISFQKFHTRDVGEEALVLVEFQTAGHGHQVGHRDFRARVPGPLRKQTLLIQRKLAVLDRHSDQGGIDGFRHRPAQQGRRSVEAFAIGLADNAPVMDDDDRAHARSLENRIVQRRPQTTIIGQLRRLAGRPERVGRRRRRQGRRGGAVRDFVF